MSLVGAFTDIAQIASSAASTGATLGTGKVAYDAYAEKDEKKKLLANARLKCLARLQWRKFVAVCWKILLPIAILFIMGWTSSHFEYSIPGAAYMIPVVWLGAGCLSTFYMSSFGWSEKTMRINTASIDEFRPCPSV